LVRTCAAPYEAKYATAVEEQEEDQVRPCGTMARGCCSQEGQGRAVGEPSAAHLATAMADAACACHRSPHAAVRLLVPISFRPAHSATLPPLADPAMFP